MPISNDSVDLQESSWKSWDDSTNFNTDTLTTKLLSHIRNNEFEQFAALIRQDFILQKNTVELESSEGTSYTTQYKKQPIIETLLNYHPDKLLQIVNELISKNKPQLFNAFIHAVEASGLHSMLFTLTEDMKSLLNVELAKMNDHAQKLLRESHPRGTTLNNLYNDLSSELTAESGHRDVHRALDDFDEKQTARDERHSDSLLGDHADDTRPRDTTLRDEFKNLAFKLRFAVRLHHDDTQFSTHRGNSRVVLGTIGNILFGFAVPFFLLHRAITGHWGLFSTNTTSSDRVNTMHTTLGFNSEMHFDKKEATETRKSVQKF